MSDNVTWFACITVIVTVAIALPIVHSNERDYQSQQACMGLGGNWETREHSNAIGCRFPVKK